MPSDTDQTGLRAWVAHLGALIDLIVVTGGLFWGVRFLHDLVTHFDGCSLSTAPIFACIAAAVPLAFVPAIATIGSLTRRARRLTTICLTLFAIDVLFVWSFSGGRLVVYAAWPVASLALIALERSLALQITDWTGQHPAALAWKTRARRLMVIVWAAPCLLCWAYCCSFGWEQLRSSSWPQVQANVIRCEPAEQSRRLIDLRYEFQVDGRTYKGNRDSVWASKGYPFNRPERDRIAEINQASRVWVAYNPKSPERSLLSPGLTVRDFMIVWGSLGCLGAFLLSWTSLAVDRRRATDRADVVREPSPGWFLFSIFLGGAYVTRLVYFGTVVLLPEIWTLLLVLHIALTYTVGLRIHDAWRRERVAVESRGKVFVVGHQSAPA